MLAREKNASGDVGAETFSLADAIRGRSVQQALAASSARAAAKDPALAELVRKEQDLGKQVNAQLGHAQQRVVFAVGTSATTRASRRSTPRSMRCAPNGVKARQEISQRFPAYADLVDRQSRHRSSRSRRH